MINAKLALWWALPVPTKKKKKKDENMGLQKMLAEGLMPEGCGFRGC